MTLSDYRLSGKLSTYLAKVEQETGREIKIWYLPASKMYNMAAATRYHPDYILVLIKAGSELSDPVIEQSIAHEVTHSWLIHIQGFCRGIYTRTLGSDEKRLVNYVLTMVSDIAVNKIIQQECFSPFSPKYLAEVEAETKAIREGLDLYGYYSKDPAVQEKIMVFRYILAWGYVQYFELEAHVKRILLSYMRAFRHLFPEQYPRVKEVRLVLVSHDIFTAEGNRGAVEAILKLWNIEELVELRCEK